MSKIRKSAKGEECTLMLFPYCDNDPEKTVLCHLPSPMKGTGYKSPDWFAVYGCKTCHDIIDGRIHVDLPQLEIEISKSWALFRTQQRLIEKGLITI